MMEFEELEKFKGETIEIAGKAFTLDIEHCPDGDWAVWNEVKRNHTGDIIYATLNYEGRCVPVEYHTAEGDMIGADVYLGEVQDFAEYKNRVIELVSKILVLT